MKRLWLFFGILAILIIPFGATTNKEVVNASTSYTITATDINGSTTVPSAGTINYQDIAFAYNTIYVTDVLTSSKIITFAVNDNAYSKTDISAFGSADNLYPVRIALNLNEQALYYSSSNAVGIDKTDVNGHSNIRKFIQPVENSESLEVDMTNIYDITCTDDGSVFAIAKSKNDEFIVVTKSKTDTFFQLICKISDLESPYSTITLSSQSRIAVGNDNSFITIANGNQIFTIDTNANIIENKFNLPTFYNICDISLDWQNNLIVLDKGSTPTIIKASANNYIQVKDLNNILGDINAFCVDNVTGIIYACNYYTVFKIEIKNENENFLSSITNDIKPNLRDYTLSSVCTVLQPKENAVVYESESLYKLNCSPISNLVLIENNPNSLYYYVLINKYKLFDNNIVLSEEINLSTPLKVEFNTGYILKTDAELTYSQPAEIDLVRTIFPKTPVYRFPTTLKDSNGEILVTTIERSTQNPNPELTILNTATLPVDGNNVDFYAVQYGSIIGYIDKNSVIEASNKPLEYIFVPTAKIKEETNVYADNKLINVTTNIVKDKEIQIVEEQNGVAKIYWLEQDVLFVGYVNMAYVDDGNLTTAQVIGISLMAGAIFIAIIILWIDIKRRKRKKLKEKESI